MSMSKVRLRRFLTSPKIKHIDPTPKAAKLALNNPGHYPIAPLGGLDVSLIYPAFDFARVLNGADGQTFFANVFSICH